MYGMQQTPGTYYVHPSGLGLAQPGVPASPLQYILMGGDTAVPNPLEPRAEQCIAVTTLAPAPWQQPSPMLLPQHLMLQLMPTPLPGQLPPGCWQAPQSAAAAAYAAAAAAAAAAGAGGSPPETPGLFGGKLPEQVAAAAAAVAAAGAAAAATTPAALSLAGKTPDSDEVSQDSAERHAPLWCRRVRRSSCAKESCRFFHLEQCCRLLLTGSAVSVRPLGHKRKSTLLQGMVGDLHTLGKLEWSQRGGMNLPLHMIGKKKSAHAYDALCALLEAHGFPAGGAGTPYVSAKVAIVSLCSALTDGDLTSVPPRVLRCFLAVDQFLNEHVHNKRCEGGAGSDVHLASLAQGV